jgi:hypothetical protein
MYTRPDKLSPAGSLGHCRNWEVSLQLAAWGLIRKKRVNVLHSGPEIRPILGNFSVKFFH